MTRCRPLVLLAILLLTTGCPPTSSPNTTADAGVTDDGGQDTDDGDDTNLANDDDPAPAQIEFPSDEFVIVTASPTAPQAQVLDDQGQVIDDAPLSWRSEDESIVTISSGGLAIGQQIGSTELVATAGAIEAAWPTRVVGEAVAQVDVVPASATISTGWQLPYMANLRDASNRPIDDERAIEWSTSDEALATIDADGLLTAHAEGEVTISATVEGIEGTATLSIEAIDIESIAISPSSPSPIERGTDLQLSVTAYAVGGDELTTQGAQWSSADESVASVNAAGLVEAVGVGSTTISAEIDGQQDMIDVEVTLPIRHLTAGDGFGCAVAGADLMCWGENGDGQLADGTRQNRQDPVVANFDQEIEKLSLGARHGCLLDDDAQIWCWGNNDYGQVGSAAGDAQESPQLVEINQDFIDLATGDDHTCAVTTTNQAFCWGKNDDDQSGHNQASTGQPTAVSTNQQFVAIAAGARHSCAITTDDEAYCWGANDRQQLGDSDENQTSTPQFVDGGYSFGSLAAGGDHTCGISNSGPPVCWGRNDRGQLGVDSTADQDIPLTLALNAGEGLNAIAAGTAHSCGLISGGHPRCWGAHDDGRLGTSTSDDALSPQPTSGDLTYSHIAVGAAHTCGRTGDNEVYCWGSSPAAGASATIVEF